MSIHEPVLLREVLSQLQPRPNQNFIDCTLGAGGHSLALLDAVKPHGKVIGIDWDGEAAVAIAPHDNLIVVHDSYRNLESIVKKVTNDTGPIEISGILLDLGLSSDQLSSGDRGFSFQGEEFLDLRFDQSADIPTAAQILQTSNERQLLTILKEFGDEPLARPIVKAILAARANGESLEKADMLVQLISSVYQKHFKKPSRINPATRTFQALRIAVNNEFGNIRNVLPQAVDMLAVGGRLAVITFHSGEDRIVKNWFRDEAKADESRIKLTTRKPIVPTDEEIKKNPRSRSAKLRVVERQ